MEDEPRRKRLKLSLTKTKKRPSHESTSVGAAIDDDDEKTAVATAVCGHDQGSATAAEAVSELNEAGGDDSSPLEPKPEPTSHTAAASAIEERREAYYSANFKSILTTVLSDSPERHVISEEGSKVVKRFMELPEPQQQLYVRLFLRKHHWIRTIKLSYKDIADNLTDIVQVLVNKDFLLDSSHLADPTEILNLLQLGELKGLCKQLNLPTSLVGNQKSSIIQAIFKHDRQQKPLFGQAQFMKTVVNKAKKVLGSCVKVAEGPREEFSRLLLLFSLTNSWIGGDEDTNFSQLIYRMLQVNVGMIVYPEYEVNVTHSLFHSTEDFEKYYISTKHEQSMVQAMEEGDDALVRRLLTGAVEAFKAELIRQDEAMSSRQSPVHTCKAPFLLPFTTGWMYARIISQAAEYLEKKKQHEEANELLELLLSQKVYCTGSRGRWTDRLALNYDHHLKRKDKCLEAIIEALKDPYLHDSKRLSLLQRARKICLSQKSTIESSKPKKKATLSKKRRASSSASSKSSANVALPYGIEDFPMMDITEAPQLHITGHRLHTGPVYLTQNSSESDHSSTSSLDDRNQRQSPSVSTPNSTGRHTQTIVGVEGYAIQHYSTEQGWPCALHAEGSSFTTLFALLMWSVIFASGVPNVFRTKFQNGPLDLYSSCFYENRKTLIDERLDAIGQASSEEISTMIEQCWDKHYGQLCVGLNWELFPSKEDAKSLGACMGGHLLGQVCQLFCKQYRQSVGGLPDLVLWNPDSRTCKFVEVKGPGDRLSHKQIIWLSRLANWSCDIEVCLVAAKRKIL